MTKSVKTIDERGHIRWYKEGTKILHRKDGPAIKYVNGSTVWYLNGEFHRTDGPAIEYVGKQILADNCLIESDPKFEKAIAKNQWWVNGKIHREDGPAIEYMNGTKHWYLNHKLHRVDGPAIEHMSGVNYWYLSGQRCIGVTSQEEFVVYKKLQLLKIKS